MKNWNKIVRENVFEEKVVAMYLRWVVVDMKENGRKEIDPPWRILVKLNQRPTVVRTWAGNWFHLGEAKILKKELLEKLENNPIHLKKCRKIVSSVVDNDHLGSKQINEMDSKTELNASPISNHQHSFTSTTSHFDQNANHQQEETNHSTRAIYSQENEENFEPLLSSSSIEGEEEKKEELENLYPVYQMNIDEIGLTLFLNKELEKNFVDYALSCNPWNECRFFYLDSLDTELSTKTFLRSWVVLSWSPQNNSHNNLENGKTSSEQQNSLNNLRIVPKLQILPYVFDPNTSTKMSDVRFKNEIFEQTQNFWNSELKLPDEDTADRCFFVAGKYIPVHSIIFLYHGTRLNESLWCYSKELTGDSAFLSASFKSKTHPPPPQNKQIPSKFEPIICYLLELLYLGSTDFPLFFEKIILFLEFLQIFKPLVLAESFIHFLVQLSIEEEFNLKETFEIMYHINQLELLRPSFLQYLIRPIEIELLEKLSQFCLVNPITEELPNIRSTFAFFLHPLSPPSLSISSTHKSPLKHENPPLPQLNNSSTKPNKIHPKEEDPLRTTFCSLLVYLLIWNKISIFEFYQAILCYCWIHQFNPHHYFIQLYNVIDNFVLEITFKDWYVIYYKWRKFFPWKAWKKVWNLLFRITPLHTLESPHTSSSAHSSPIPSESKKRRYSVSSPKLSLNPAEKKDVS